LDFFYFMHQMYFLFLAFKNYTKLYTIKWWINWYKLIIGEQELTQAFKFYERAPFFGLKMLKFWQENAMRQFSIFPEEWQNSYAVSWYLFLSSSFPLCFLLGKLRSSPLLRGLKKALFLWKMFQVLTAFFNIIETSAILVIWPNHLLIGIICHQKHSSMQGKILNI